MDVVELLRELIPYRSVNDPIRGIKPSKDIATFIHDILAGWGIDSEVIESNGYYSILGSVGVGEPYVMLLAHYDVVPANASRWDYDPFNLTVVGEKAFGRGALDDKSNVAAVMLALKELNTLNPRRMVLFALTGDEEVGGNDGAKLIVDKLRSTVGLPKYLINGDGANHIVIRRRRKIFEVKVLMPRELVTIRGRKYVRSFNAIYPITQHAHAAYFISGVDTHPLITASAFVREGDYYVASLRGSFLKSNVVPASVEVEYVVPDQQGEEVVVDAGLTDLLKSVVTLAKTPVATRAFSEFGVSITPNVYVSGKDFNMLVIDVRAMAYKEDVEEAFNNVVKEVLPNAVLEVETDVGGFVNTPEDSKLIKVFREVLNDLNVTYRVGEGAGASDSRYFTPYGVEVIDFGPMGGGMHGDNEYVDLRSLKVLPRIYFEAVKRLFRV